MAAAVLLGCSVAHAATIVVNDASGDSTTGLCTLADAVAAINGAQAVNGCAAGDGVADTIDLSFFTAPTTIAFQNPNSPDTQSGIQLTKPATITGPVDANGRPLVTIARSSTSDVYFRVIGTSADLTLANVNVSGGHLNNARGAGIDATSQASLTISNSTISGNTISGNTYYSGGGIAAEYGNITLSGSTVSGNVATNNGGGVYSLHEGSITLNNSSVSGNRTYYYGAGIYNFNGDVTLTGSTVSNNRAYRTYTVGGNTYTFGGAGGGGIFVYKSLHMTNSTVSGNYSRNGPGGVLVYGKFYSPAIIRHPARPHRTRPQVARPSTSMFLSGNAYIDFSTIAHNSIQSSGGPREQGGMWVQNYLHMYASIVHDNAYGDLAFSYSAVPFIGSNNIVGSPPQQSPRDTRDCDPKLGPLANWGGTTSTLPLLSGSCAIDTGPAAPLVDGVTADQRGRPRPAGTTTDVGAFERQGDNDPDLIFDGGFETSG